MEKNCNPVQISLNKDTHPDTHEAICNICGKELKMSRDHVPLKSLGNRGTVTIKSHHAWFPIKSVTRQNGIVYRTICAECNNTLGSLYDPYYKKFYDEVARFADIVLKTQIILNSYTVEIDTIPSLLARSLIGHILATKIHQNGPFMDELREYVLNPSSSLPDSLHLYVWFYADSHYKILPEYVIIKLTEPIEIYYYYIIKSYPCAYMLTNDGLPYKGLTDLLRYKNGEKTKVSLDLLYHPKPDWPESDFVGRNDQSVLIGANNLNSIET